MYENLTALRHAMLFELLRQQNLSVRTTASLRAHQNAKTHIDHDDAMMIRGKAVQSWGAAA
jgi:hypothetical protein